jgi:hypothetical protein
MYVNPGYFNQLTSLELWNGMGNEWAICCNTLKQLLLRAPLTYMLLQRIGNLTDQLIASVLALNPLLTLRNVVIDYCHNVTISLFWQLLQQPNELSVLRCWHSKGVTMEDKTVIKDTVKEENLSLYWEWYPYNEYEELMESGHIVEDDSTSGDEEED